jgi:hypothetical protein
MYRPYKAIFSQLLIHWNGRTVISLYVNILRAITERRCLRMYAHASLTLLSYCGVHTVFPLCVAISSRALSLVARKGA